MAFENNALGGVPGLKAGADLSSSQFLCCVLDASGDAVLAGDGAACLGVLQNDPGSGDAAQVNGPGNTTKVVFGATVAAGALVASDAAGKAVTATTGEYILGECIVGGDADEVGTVHLTMPGRVA